MGKNITFILLMVSVCCIGGIAAAQDTTPPLAVDTLTAKVEIDGITVSLAWTGYDESLAGDVAAYRIYMDTDEFSDVSGIQPIADVDQGIFHYTVTNLAENMPYYFAVVAVDTSNNALTTAAAVAVMTLKKDIDDDLVDNALDNCPYLSNADQADRDSGYVFVPRSYFTEPGCEQMCYAEYENHNGIEFLLGISSIGGKVATIHGTQGRSIDIKYHVDEVYVLHTGGRGTATTLSLTFTYDDESTSTVGLSVPHDCSGSSASGENWTRTHIGTYPCSGCCNNWYMTTIINPTSKWVDSVKVSGSGGWNGTQVNAITILKSADKFGDACDNCPGVYNPDQLDSNDDGEGDACNLLPPELVLTDPTDGASLKNVEQIVFALADDYVVDDDAVIDSINLIDGYDMTVPISVIEAEDQFTITPDDLPLPDDHYRVSFSAIDLAGKTEHHSFSFTVDNQPPTAPGITGGAVFSGALQPRPSANSSNTTTPTLTGSREDGTAVWVNGSLRVELGAGEWETDLNLVQGDNAIEVWLVDAAGNRGPSTWLDITADSIAPALNSVVPSNNSFLNTAPEAVIVNYNEAVSGLHLDNSIHAIKDSSQTEIDGTWEISGGNQLVFRPANAFAESTYTVTLLLEDNYTNQGEEVEYLFTVDSTPPPAPGINPVEATTHKVTQVITGTKEAYAAILLGGQEVVGNTAETTWQHTVSLDDVTNQFSFEAMDRAGNVSDAVSVEIVLDDIAPPPVDNLWVNRQGNGTYVTLNWTGYDESVHDDIALYRVYVQSSDFSDVSALSVHNTVNAGTFSYRVNDLIEGETYYFAAVAVDLKGNASNLVTAIAQSSQRVTFVSGHITNNRTWTKAAGPYVVTGDVTVRYSKTRSSAATLTIEPGVEVRFNAGTGLYIGYPDSNYYYYRGALSAQGTAEAPIVFTSNASEPAPGDWIGIKFRDYTDDSLTQLEYCVVEFGGHAQNANLYFHNTSPRIKNSIIRSSGGYGIYLSSSSPTVQGNSITANTLSGIYSDDGSTALIQNNIISDNGHYALEAHPNSYRKISANSGTGNAQNHFSVRGGTITTNSTWGNQGFAYVIAGDVTVRYSKSRSSAAVLTLNPGVELRFNSGKGLYVGYPDSNYYYYRGALSAQGTAEAPIVFTSNANEPAPGDWKGIHFRDYTYDTSTALNHFVIEYGTHGIYSNKANPSIQNGIIRRNSGHGINLSSSSPQVKNNLISENGASGIYLTGSSNPVIGGEGLGNTISSNGGYGIYSVDAAPFPTISHNTIADNGSYAVRVGARMALYNNTITGNTNQAVEIVGEHVTTNTTWSNNGIPYIVLGSVTVRYANSRSSLATLTIEPGVEVRFNTETGLYIGYPDSNYYYYRGALSAQGTAEAPIVFTSNASEPAPGDWIGIKFRDYTDDSLTQLEYCVVEFGGHAQNANLYFHNTSPRIKNSIIRSSGGYGIYLSSSSPTVQGNSITANTLSGIYSDDGSTALIQNNIISDNGHYALEAHPNSYRKISANSGTGNAQNHFSVRGGTITTNSTWGNQGFAYVIAGDVTVRYSKSRSSAAVLTLNPGVELRFNSGKGLYVGYPDSNYYYHKGALSAQGTAEAPIVFTSNAAIPSSGDWKGIYFRNYTDDGLSQLEHCIIEYGGHTHNADIYLANAKPTLQYNTIRNSSHSGIYVNGAGSNGASIRCNNLKDNHYGVTVVSSARPVIRNNNFLRNQNYGINNSGTAAVDAIDNWWNDVNGPGYNGDDVNGNVIVSPWLTAESECIDTPPTNTAPFVPKNPVPASGAVRVPVTAEGQPVVVNLKWSGGDPNPWDAVVYDIYFGAAADALELIAEAVETTSL